MENKGSAWVVPFIFLAVLVVSFGLFIPFLGFYWDDWPVILTGQFFGAPGYMRFYEYDRPVSAWTYIVTFPLLGTSPANWHIFTLLLRWGTTLAMWWTLIRLWPNRRQEATWAALLFSVYPVFTQQAVSVAYSQHWICYLLFFISIGAMVQAQRSARRWFWPLTFLSAATSLLHLLTMEYFAGLELLRPLILWFLISEHQSNRRERVRQVVVRWLPYLPLLIGFVIWRLFFLKFPEGGDGNAPGLLYQLLKTPLDSGLRFLQIALQDTTHMLLMVWANTITPTTIDLTNRFLVLSWITAGVVAALLTLILARRIPPAVGTESDSGSSWIRQVLILGAAGVLLGILPVWFTDRQIIVGAYSNRFGLPAMFGASLLIVGLLTELVRLPIQRVLLLSLMVGMAVGLHLRIGNDYRWTWVKQTRFYWQMAWRMPALEADTAILSDGELFPSVGIYSTAMGINLMYPPTESESRLPYWFFSLGREFSYRMPELMAGMQLEGGVRNYLFEGNSHNSLVVYYQPEDADCLRILTPQDGEDPDLPAISKQTLPLVNLARILPDSSADGPSENIFGPEPEHGWCYLFQKADLARQQSDWQAVTELGDQARQAGYNLDNSQSNTPQEWIPFIEGYAHAGRWQEAGQISAAAFEKDPKMAPRLCGVWHALANAPSGGQEQQAAVQSAQNSLSCLP